MILLIDNYDSFTYNLVQAIEALGENVMVKQNDETLDLDSLNPEKIIISPGPGTPKDSGISSQIIKNAMPEIPILGVCLGHQCIGSVFGVNVRQSKRILHGKTSLIHHNTTGLFKGIPSPFQGARYHSLSLESVPTHFVKTAWTNDNEIMGIQHETLPLFGVQFHPESFLTPMGSKILENFVNV
jgi:anthranilate synthase/aminodeoxychorismate synthase-like glutamine amidotransferase